MEIFNPVDQLKIAQKYISSAGVIFGTVRFTSSDNNFLKLAGGGSFNWWGRIHGSSLYPERLYNYFGIFRDTQNTKSGLALGNYLYVLVYRS